VWLAYARDLAADANVRDAAAEAWTYMQGFTRDIVDSKNKAGNGYNIRTKDASGNPTIPEGQQSDLACMTCFDWLDKNSECTARFTAAVLGYGIKLSNNCGAASGNAYEVAATGQHYYEYPIFRQFHIAAIMAALIAGYDESAHAMLAGLADRMDTDFNAPSSQYSAQVQKGQWEGDLAMTALNGASAGLPLTWKEARLLQSYSSYSIDTFLAWPNWDVWSLPDGTYDYRPGVDGNQGFNEEDMAFFIEFCWSPFRNPSSAMPVDCDIIKDPSQW
jgi:hypothetical protein